MSQTVVDRMRDEFHQLEQVLESVNEVSLRSTVNDNFRKSLLLCASSYFERRLSDDVTGFVRESVGNNSAIVAFFQNKAVHRQFHTWFNWKEKNANSFFGLFGEPFKIYMQGQVKADENLDKAIKAFLELGETRNRLVHQDYGSFYLEKTAEEIYGLYRKASQFVEMFPSALRTHVRIVLAKEAASEFRQLESSPQNQPF